MVAIPVLTREQFYFHCYLEFELNDFFQMNRHVPSWIQSGFLFPKAPVSMHNIPQWQPSEQSSEPDLPSLQTPEDSESFTQVISRNPLVREGLFIRKLNDLFKNRDSATGFVKRNDDNKRVTSGRYLGMGF